VRLDRLIAGVVIAGAAISALAQQDGADKLVGKVQNVYVREANNLFYEKKLVRRAATTELWAEIRFAQETGGGTTSAMAKLGRDASIERGDVVVVWIPETGPADLPLLADTPLVEALIAGRDTVGALGFALPALQHLDGVGLETRSCTRSMLAGADRPAGAR
jgi:hypothetical protein